MTGPARPYPRTVRLAAADVTLRSMGPGDDAAVLAFAQALPAHDLLFLRRDITRRDVVLGWQRAIARGRIVTILAERQGELLGYATIDRGDLSWSPHVAELRVLVAASMRGKGLGRVLTHEAFATALALGIEKVVAQMTVDQKDAIACSRKWAFAPRRCYAIT